MLEPRLEEAKNGTRIVFFMDAAHFVLAPFLGVLWSINRLFIRGPSGRQRFNVLGAFEAISHELITVTNEDYINSLSIVELMQKISDKKFAVPITLILDNARYQKCQLVTDFATKAKIELLYLPPYSPNLNLIERLWKFVKKDCLYSKYYEKFDQFKTAIKTCLAQTSTIHKNTINTLMTLNFQTFEESKIMAI